MSDRKKPRSLSEIVNDVLRAVRDYYDSEYVYYIEKEYGDIETIFEWCAENVPWQRDASGRTAAKVDEAGDYKFNRGRLQCEFAAG